MEMPYKSQFLKINDQNNIYISWKEYEVIDTEFDLYSTQYGHQCILQQSLTSTPDILLNVFLAIAVDNLADADALGDAEEEEGKEGEEVSRRKRWCRRECEGRRGIKKREGRWEWREIEGDDGK